MSIMVPSVNEIMDHKNTTMCLSVSYNTCTCMNMCVILCVGIYVCVMYMHLCVGMYVCVMFMHLCVGMYVCVMYMLFVSRTVSSTCIIMKTLKFECFNVSGA